jgi:hypothetical protein
MNNLGSSFCVKALTASDEITKPPLALQTFGTSRLIIAAFSTQILYGPGQVPRSRVTYSYAFFCSGVILSSGISLYRPNVAWLTILFSLSEGALLVERHLPVKKVN